jgi:hypothetical protein
VKFNPKYYGRSLSAPNGASFLIVQFGSHTDSIYQYTYINMCHVQVRVHRSVARITSVLQSSR